MVEWTRNGIGIRFGIEMGAQSNTKSNQEGKVSRPMPFVLSSTKLPRQNEKSDFIFEFYFLLAVRTRVFDVCSRGRQFLQFSVGFEKGLI